MPATPRDLARRLATVEQRQRRMVVNDDVAGLAVFTAAVAAYPPPPGFERESLAVKFAAAMATHPALYAAVEAQQRTAPSPLWVRLCGLAQRVRADADRA